MDVWVDPWGVFHRQYPGCSTACIDWIREDLFKRSIPPEEVAAIFVEPIQGEGGYIVPPPEFHQKLYELAKDFGILFVDDETSLTKLGRKILKRLGYEVFTFTDSMQALEMFAKNPDGYDLVVTDMTMPGMTGMHLSRAILAIRPEMQIILCTGHSDLIDERKAKEEGIRHFMMKPLRRNELAKVIRNALDEQKARS